jgi:hypothetical protein
MTIRCPECGYENRDMYRFCGMCGATLRREAVGAPASAVESPAVTPEPAPVEPPSARPPAATQPAPPPSLDYLLEEESPKSHGKLYLTLALLVIAAGVIAWHWESDQRTSAEPAATSTPAASTTTATTQTPPPPANNPSPSKPEDAATPKPSDSAKPVPAPPVVTQETLPATKPAEEAEAKPQEQSPTPPASSDTPADSSSTADTSQPASAVVPPTPAPKPKPDPKVATPSAPALKGDDKLVADGEKYLYGNGVPEDCDLAQKNLKAAAAHSNARALTLMGAMYATGHCVDRDLPTAYRWFAKALHQDPSNARVQQDIEILWKQMTPGERQLATKTGG